jgi:hypothetical protein
VYPKHRLFSLWEIQKIWNPGISFTILFYQFFFTLFGLAILGLVFECLTELIGNTNDTVGNGFLTHKQPFGRSIFCAQEWRNKPLQEVFLEASYSTYASYGVCQDALPCPRIQEKNFGALGRNIIIRGTGTKKLRGINTTSGRQKPGLHYWTRGTSTHIIGATEYLVHSNVCCVLC